jgi:hypothetical protein
MELDEKDINFNFMDSEMNEPCNAKTEFENALIKARQDSKDVKCATIKIEACNKRCMEQFKQYEDPNPVNADLKLIASRKDGDMQRFLDKLDIVYDCGYGGQELYGTVWFTDGTWLTRYEYDGAEGWQYNVCPVIKEDLL